MWLPQEAPDAGHFYEVVWAAVATALSTVFAILIGMMRGRIADLKERARLAEARADRLQAALGDHFDKHHTDADDDDKADTGQH
jgi:heme exporter protein D